MAVGLIAKLGAAIVKRSPGILTGAGIAGMVLAGIMAVKETPKANLAIDRATTDKGEDLTVLEKAKVYAKAYWKPITVGFVSGAAIVGGAAVGAKKRAALEAALALTTNALTSQSEKIVEKYGKPALEQIQGAVAKDRINNQPPKTEEKKPLPNNDIQGDTVYHDAWTGYEFETTPTRIIEGVGKANAAIRKNDELSINDFFDFIRVKGYGDEVTIRRYGDINGWTTWKGPVELEYKIIDTLQRDGRTYLIMGFNINPTDKL